MSLKHKLSKLTIISCSWNKNLDLETLTSWYHKILQFFAQEHEIKTSWYYNHLIFWLRTKQNVQPSSLQEEVWLPCKINPGVQEKLTWYKNDENDFPWARNTWLCFNESTLITWAPRYWMVALTWTPDDKSSLGHSREVTSTLKKMLSKNRTLGWQYKVYKSKNTNLWYYLCR